MEPEKALEMIRVNKALIAHHRKSLKQWDNVIRIVGDVTWATDELELVKGARAALSSLVQEQENELRGLVTEYNAAPSRAAGSMA